MIDFTKSCNYYYCCDDWIGGGGGGGQQTLSNWQSFRWHWKGTSRTSADANAYIFGVVINDDWFYKVMQLLLLLWRLNWGWWRRRPQIMSNRQSFWWQHTCGKADTTTGAWSVVCVVNCAFCMVHRAWCVGGGGGGGQQTLSNWLFFRWHRFRTSWTAADANAYILELSSMMIDYTKSCN